MKKIFTIWAVILLITAGCKESKQSTDDFITVDVTANYPQKELILQDFMDVEYIPLETTDDFLCQGNIRDISKDVIIATNIKFDGNIFIFDRNGKALKKINHKGGGNEEYESFSRIILDEENNEIFVNNSFAKKILVYDLEGNFKRKLSIKKDLSLYEMYNFDHENLFCHDDSNVNTENLFLFISKQDGSITKEIQIPFKEKQRIETRFEDEKISGMFYVFVPQTLQAIIPYFNDYIVTEYSADTLYRYSSNHTMKPFIVRTPSIQSMNTKIFLLPNLLTERYYFMETIEKKTPISITNIVYDKQEKALFRYKVYNGDYTNNKEAYLKSISLDYKIPSWQYLDAAELVQDYKDGKLKGKLKEIAATLNEESNPVIMLIKHKK